ncbi:related to COX7 - cytochrome-c oxidase, subunit VII [Melanopsichium pennsylvanicum]|uniref:Related to COX7 - cytochrome-c oxidase, subunit VII n=1 Tax=Melanopsichium pennsylvanicum TaxID=63383 RepID=A0AAJ4XK26_9BASI|nr:related to COX7 - cytochrome-c oxidase, subunit VII [Melanopsichium pennsylvanicum]
MDALVYRKNTILERQRALQADSRPVFQRLPRSRLYMGIFMTLFGVGMYGTAVGFYNMALGKKRQS